MCGRYVITKPISKTRNIVKSAINIHDSENYNCHPQQFLPVIKKYKNGNTIECLKWGILPAWAKKKDFKPLINARLETIHEKISFKSLFKQTRCVVVADGYFEWKRDENNKIPYYIYREDNKTIFFAGIYSDNQFCIITMKSSDKIIDIHNRQPVILDETDINNYLKLQNDGSNLIDKYKFPNLNFHKVSNNVNKPSNNNLNLIKQI